jgi:hypothetical protein
MTQRLLTLVLLVFTGACGGSTAAPPAPGPAAPERPGESHPARIAPEPLDYLIHGGRIVDGTGAPWILGDLGIRGDRIVAMAPPGGWITTRSGERSMPGGWWCHRDSSTS